MQDLLKDEEMKKEIKPKKGMTEIMPLRDFRITQNKVDIEIKKGEKVEVPNKYLQNLKTEKVIK